MTMMTPSLPLPSLLLLLLLSLLPPLALSLPFTPTCSPTFSPSLSPSATTSPSASIVLSSAVVVTPNLFVYQLEASTSYEITALTPDPRVEVYNTLCTHSITWKVIPASRSVDWFHFEDPRIVGTNFTIEQQTGVPDFFQFILNFANVSSVLTPLPGAFSIPPAEVLTTTFAIEYDIGGLNITSIVPVDVEVTLKRPCPPGYFSATGFNEAGCSPCPLNFYQTDTRSTNCLPCSLAKPVTARVGSTTVEACITDIGFVVLDSNLTVACKEGMNCSTPGLSLESLPLVPGYYRTNSQSIDVRICPRQKYCKGGTFESNSTSTDDGASTNVTSSSTTGRRRMIDAIAAYVGIDVSSRVENPVTDGHASRALTSSSSSSAAIFAEYNNDSDLCIEYHQGAFCYTCAPGTAKRGGDRLCSLCEAGESSEDFLILTIVCVGIGVGLLVTWLVVAGRLIFKDVRAFSEKKKADALRTKRLRKKLMRLRREGDTSITMARLIEMEEEQEKENLERELTEMRNSPGRAASPGEDEGKDANNKNKKKKKNAKKRDLTRFFVNGEEGLMYVGLVGVKLRVLIGFLQVVAALSAAYVPVLPAFFDSVAEVFSFFTFDLIRTFDFGCALPQQSHYVSLLFSTLVPIGISVILVVLNFLTNKSIIKRLLRSRTNVGLEERFRNLNFSMFLFLLFLIYPSVAATVLKTFECEKLDDGRAVLKIDPSVSCLTQQYGYFLGYAILMLFVYVLGIPLCYFLILNRSKAALNPSLIELNSDHSSPAAASLAAKGGKNEGMIVEMRKRNPDIRLHRFLWFPYRPKFYWYENFELLRKLFQASIVAFVAPGTTVQMVFVILITLPVCVVLHVSHPYLKHSDNVAAMVTQWCIVFLSLMALLIKFNEDSTGISTTATSAAYGSNAISVSSGTRDYDSTVLGTLCIVLFLIPFLLVLFQALMVDHFYRILILEAEEGNDAWRRRWMKFTRFLAIFFSIDNPLLLWGGGRQEEKSPAEFKLQDFDRVLKDDPRVHLWVKERFDVIKKNMEDHFAIVNATVVDANRASENVERENEELIAEYTELKAKMMEEKNYFAMEMRALHERLGELYSGHSIPTSHHNNNGGGDDVPTSLLAQLGNRMTVTMKSAQQRRKTLVNTLLRPSAPPEVRYEDVFQDRHAKAKSHKSTKKRNNLKKDVPEGSGGASSSAPDGDDDFSSTNVPRGYADFEFEAAAPPPPPSRRLAATMTPLNAPPSSGTASPTTSRMRQGNAVLSNSFRSKTREILSMAQQQQQQQQGTSSTTPPPPLPPPRIDTSFTSPTMLVNNTPAGSPPPTPPPSRTPGMMMMMMPGHTPPSPHVGEGGTPPTPTSRNYQSIL